ncbi:MAG: PorT family protein [Muribaculaceae bacterium]|nr:PorT family protein [Muribaculaceae bacterium]
MKKTLIFMCALMLSMGAWAQSSSDDEFTTIKRPLTISVGVKGGANYSFAGEPKAFDLGMKGNVGFQGGVAVNLHFSDKLDYTPSGTGRWGVQVEGLFAQRNLKTNTDDIKMSCFAVPVLAQFYVSPSLAIEAGPTFTGVLSTSPKELVQGSAETGFLKLGLDKIKGFDIMATVGVGYYHDSGFTASARFNLGNSNLAGNLESKVSSAEVSVGYLFKIFK